MSLIHYTDALGLMGIIQHQALWATDARFLNDSMEIHAGLQLVESRCSEMMQRVRTSTDRAIRATERLYAALPEFLYANIEARNIYIVSFSESRDNLRQWMAYCPKNAGYAIEFNSDKILVDGSFERDNHVVCRLEKVDYHEDKIDEIISPESLIKEIEEAGSHIERAALKTANKLMFHCCAVKPFEFYDERERRLIIQ